VLSAAVLLTLSGCGLLSPGIDCIDVPEVPCQRAASLTLERLEPGLPSVTSIEVQLDGCGQAFSCPPAVAERVLTVTVHFADGTERQVGIARADVGLPPGRD
jgi:hypothetical protein